jgi:hypothetical protein
LPGFTSRAEITPSQAARFGDAQPSYVKQIQQNMIARFRIRSEYPMHILFGQDPFRQALLVAGQYQFGGRVRRHVSHPAAEAEEAFDPCKRANAGDRRQPFHRSAIVQSFADRQELCGGESFLRDSEAVQNQVDSSLACANWAVFGAKVG